MRTLEFGLAAMFFLIGLIMAWSKSAKGATVLTFLIGIIGGGGGIVFGEGRVPFLPRGASADQEASMAGALLLAIGLGGTVGLIVGMISKVLGKNRGVEIGVAQPEVDPKSKLP